MVGLFGRRGQAVSDLSVFLIILFVIAVLAYIVVKVFGGVNDGFQGNADIIPDDAETASSDAYDGFSNGFNAAVVVALGVMYMGLFITSRKIGTEPIWFVINVFLLMAALILAVVLGNSLEQGFNTTEFVTERANMAALVYVGNHWLGFAIGAVAVIIVGLFAKPD